MSVKVVTFAGISFYPTTIETEDMRIGEGPSRMLGGALRFYHRAYKKKWSINWTNVPEVTVSGIRTRYRNSASQAYVDQDQTTYTVILTALKEKLSADQISLPGVYYYDIDMDFEEV